MGQEIPNGINVTYNSKASITNGNGGVIYSTGCGEFASSISNTTGIAAFTFQGIGHYTVDGKLRDTGIVIFNNKVSGNLSFAGNTYGVYKDEIDKAGNAITKIWSWK